MFFKKIELAIIIGVLIVVSGIGFAFNYSPKKEALSNKNYSIIEKWDLPKELQEVSGISWLGDNKIACIEDESAVIYIFNLETSEVEKEIKFGAPGDFEGLAISKNKAYALRSDGTIFVIENYTSKDSQTKKFDTFLNSKNNTESLTLDDKNNRLLISVKDNDPFTKESKGIYAFDLSSKELKKEPIYELDFNKDFFKNYKEKKIEKTFRPSEVAIHPQTRDIYVLEGVNPKLLILDAKGRFKSIIRLDKDDFNQAEGLTFSPNGDLYISNEGKKESGNILKVHLN